MADNTAIEVTTYMPNVTGPSTEPGNDGLDLLLGSIAQAIDRQDIGLAVRLADRARRLASKDPACNLLYARLLIEAGRAKEALAYLKDSDAPDFLLVYGTALLNLGLLPEATECCQNILRKFSINAVDGLPLFASRLGRAHGNDSPLGWVGIDDDLNLVGEASGASRVDIECADGTRSLIRVEGGRDELIPFVCSVPASAPGPLVIRSGDREMIGSGLSWPPEFNLSAWMAMEGNVLLGEAQLGWSPKLRLGLELSNSQRPEKRAIAPRFDAGSSYRSFSTSLLPFELAAYQIDVAVVLPDRRRVPPVGSPIVPGRRSSVAVGDWRNNSAQSSLVANSSALSESAGIIDIIVPVYAGERETLDCLQSVLGTINVKRAEVVVVNDASPAPQLCKALASLARANRITLITNSCNLGFAGAVNRAMKLHPDRDIILLNSDTTVFGDWVERLNKAAYISADIGTVTPLGESGSITDYSPGTSLVNVSAEEIDRITSETNSGGVVDIPVGVGFCMYIKRKCLDQTGELDAITFGKGYGEENDLCLRARSLGWRHVAATNVFIAHRGGRSFGKTAKVLRKRNSRVLNALHPGYDGLIEDFSATDPLLAARRAIDMKRLLTLASRPVLLITHDLFGGVNRHIGEREKELSAAGHTVLVLQRSASKGADSKVSLTVSSLGLGNLKFDPSNELPLLEQLLRNLGVSHIELHHFIGLPPTVFEMATQLGVPYDLYIHDYSWICPRVTLIDGSGRYCGEPPVAACELCIQKNGSAIDESITVSALRDRTSNLVEKARRVIVPSADARERLARYTPERRFDTTPWELVAIPAMQSPRVCTDRIRIAVIGAIGIPKGYEVLLECARDAAARDLNLEFVVIGYSVDDQPLIDTGRVFVTGPYREDEVGTLLDREDCSIAFFPSVAPETWCYSLTYAITRGLPIIAFDLGAQAERLRDYPLVELLPTALNPQQVNFALVNWGRKLAAPEQLEAEPNQFAANDHQSGNTDELISSVQTLNLPEGLYAFTVRDGSPPRNGSETLALPALQVGIGPSPSPGSVEFLTGSSTVERWLAYRTDMVVIRILGGDGYILLTSLQKHDSPSLAVNVERLNAHPGSLATKTEEIELSEARKFDSLAVRLMAHIRYIGDLDFDEGYAGWTGHEMWIEGFAVLALGDLPPDSIEYRGLVSNGLQTPWMSNQALCGSRGGGLPLLGYAVRLKPAWSERYQCVYFGRFFSGEKIGPIENGALCSSDLPRDPLEAIELRITERQLQTTSTAKIKGTSVYG